jgi:alpha-tubulin suppressor-like RCC1 family protein
MSGVAQVIAGAHHTCARGVDGVVRCWGEALSGRLGVAGSSGAHGPAIVPGLVGVVELASGRAHACARLDGGAVRCWGDNENGQLGRGGADQATPVAVKMPGDAPAEEIGAGGDWTCARLPKGAVHCWGIGGLGPLDPPEAGNDDAGHQKPMRNAGAISIAVGHDFVFARMDDGDLHGWGSNGDSVLLASGAPYGLGRIVHVDQAVALTAGGYHACATLRDGTARCWGANHGGELGDGTLSIPSEPKLLKGIENVAQIGLGSAFLCALDTRGVVRCTGANESGQLGDGTTKGRRSPAPVLGL